MVALVLGGCGKDGVNPASAAQPHKGDYWFNPGPVCQSGHLYVYAENGKLFVNEIEQRQGDCYYDVFKAKYLHIP